MIVSDDRLAAMAPHDPAAFAELHARHDVALRRFARRKLRDEHDANDAVQDTWMRALAALRDSTTPVLSVRPWLFAIARNVCLDRHRHSARCVPSELPDEAYGAAPGADEQLALRDSAAEALGYVAKLSRRQRHALLLREVAGLEGAALGRALGTDARQASAMVTDARRSITELRAGRTLSCEAARDQLERVRIRNRTLKAHLDRCNDCSSFARRRVASRVSLHGFGLLALFPAPLRNLLVGRGGDVAGSAAATAAAAFIAFAGPPAAEQRPEAPPSARAVPGTVVMAPPAARTATRTAARPVRRSAPVTGQARTQTSTRVRVSPARSVVAAPRPVVAARPQSTTPAAPVAARPDAVRDTVERVVSTVDRVVPATVRAVDEIVATSVVPPAREAARRTVQTVAAGLTPPR